MFTIRAKTKRGGSQIMTVRSIEDVRRVIESKYKARLDARAVNEKGVQVAVSSKYPANRWNWYSE